MHLFEKDLSRFRSKTSLAQKTQQRTTPIRNPESKKAFPLARDTKLKRHLALSVVTTQLPQSQYHHLMSCSQSQVTRKRRRFQAPTLLQRMRTRSCSRSKSPGALTSTKYNSSTTCSKTRHRRLRKKCSEIWSYKRKASRWYACRFRTLSRSTKKWLWTKARKQKRAVGILTSSMSRGSS